MVLVSQDIDPTPVGPSEPPEFAHSSASAPDSEANPARVARGFQVNVVLREGIRKDRGDQPIGRARREGEVRGWLSLAPFPFKTGEPGTENEGRRSAAIAAGGCAGTNSQAWQ